MTVQVLEEQEYRTRLDFCQQTKQKIIEFHELLEYFTSSDDVTFHISDKINSCIWGKQEPYEFWQHVAGSARLNV
jgi:hypothetical protein